MNRLAPEKHIQLFGDGVHKFYLEERCTDPKMDGSPLCLKCSAPNTSKKQYARTFPRGLINEPIPPDIHLFDSPWYHQQVKKWGAPSARVIMYALEFQQEARKGTSLDPSKVVEPLLEKDNMPRKAAVSAVSAVSVVSAVSAVKEETISIPNVDTPVVKKTRKPRTAKRAIVDAPILPMEPISTTYPPSDSLSVLSLFQQEQEEKKEQEQEKGQEQEQEQEDKKGKKKAVKRKPSVKKDKKEKTETVYDKLVHPYPVVHKDSCIPTHLEQSIEEQSLSDYETEIIPFSIFILDNVVYFRDSKKNKLYRRIKEKTIGQYVGRYDSYTDSIVTDIPDSDDECD